MKHLYSFLAVLFFGVLFYASTTVNKVSTTKTSYEQWEEKQPYSKVVSYIEPVIKPASETIQQQKKGDVTITCQIVPYRIDSIFEQKKRYVTADPKRPGYDVLEIENTPKYSTSPSDVQFNINIKNNQDRILKLNDVALVSIIDGVQYTIPAENLVDWKNGLIVKGFEKNYTIRGPQLSALQNAKVLYFSINDVPVSYDAAGNITKKENFEWFFTCELGQAEKQSRVTYSYKYEPIETIKCAACDGRGYTQRTIKCRSCDGYGKKKSQYDGSIYTCTRCSGSGKETLQDNCGGCAGRGMNEFPKSEMPRAVNSITWTGWSVQVKTIPAGATIKVVDVNTGKYKNAGTSNTTVTWYSSDSESYPIIVEYHGREIKVLPYGQNGNPVPSILVECEPKLVVKKGTEVK